MKYVYELINTLGTVEYVGETETPEIRFRQHTRTKPGHRGHGNFYGRQDLTLNIVSGPLSKQEAKQLEGKLKKEYGFEWTEHTKCIKGGQANKGREIPWVDTSGFFKIVTCKHCGKQGKSGNIGRWHNDNCKHK